MVNLEKAQFPCPPTWLKMILPVFFLIIVVAIQLASCAPVRADVTYDYSGPGPISGYVTFTTNVPGTYQGVSDIVAWQLSWTWSGGTLTLYPPPPSGFIYSVGYTEFTFGPTGNITSWNFSATQTDAGGAPSISISANLPDESPPEYDVVFTSNTGGYAYQYGGPVLGVWTAVPAPCSILLLGSSLLGLAVARLRVRWRK